MFPRPERALSSYPGLQASIWSKRSSTSMHKSNKFPWLTPHAIDPSPCRGSPTYVVENRGKRAHVLFCFGVGFAGDIIRRHFPLNIYRRTAPSPPPCLGCHPGVANIAPADVVAEGRSRQFGSQKGPFGLIKVSFFAALGLLLSPLGSLRAPLGRPWDPLLREMCAKRASREGLFCRPSFFIDFSTDLGRFRGGPTCNPYAPACVECISRLFQNNPKKSSK